MIIGIDGNEANVKERVGTNEYAFQLIWGLSKLQEKRKNQINLIVYLKEKPIVDLPKETQNFKYKIIPGKRSWVLTKLIPRLFFGDDRPDIFFSPSHYAPPLLPVPLVTTIHDLGYLEFSEQFPKKVFWQLKWWSAISIFVSKALITVSNSTKDDIVRHYPWVKNKIYVTYLGFDEKFINNRIEVEDVRRIKNKYSIVGNYVLYLGTLKPSKNIEGLIRAFSIVIQDFPDLKLVVAGKKGWMFDKIFSLVVDQGLRESVIFTDFIPEEDKPILIKGSRLFAMPSFWEGFGLDALEAMAIGVPVVASNVGSIPEVVRDTGILVDPRDIKDLAKAIIKVLSLSRSDYNSMVSKGLTRAKEFSWEKTASKTLEIFENVYRQNR